MLNLNTVNLKCLQAIAKKIGIKGFSTMRKPALMGAIAELLEDNRDDIAGEVARMIEEFEAEAPTKDKGQVKPSLGIKELTFNGKTQSIGAWADEVGLKRPALYDRINRQGWSTEEALTIPAGGRRKAAKSEDTAEDQVVETEACDEAVEE